MRSSRLTLSRITALMLLSRDAASPISAMALALFRMTATVPPTATFAPLADIDRLASSTSVSAVLRTRTASTAFTWLSLPISVLASLSAFITFSVPPAVRVELEDVEMDAATVRSITSTFVRAVCSYPPPLIIISVFLPTEAWALSRLSSQARERPTPAFEGAAASAPARTRMLDSSAARRSMPRSTFLFSLEPLRTASGTLLRSSFPSFIS